MPHSMRKPPMPDAFREDDLIAHIRASNAALGPRVQIGPGDDLAMIDFHGRSLLAGADQVAPASVLLTSPMPVPSKGSPRPR